MDHTLGVVQRKRDTNFMLVTQDGSKLEDAPGTQDMSHIVSHVAIQLQNAFSYKCIDMHTCACTQVYLSCVAI